MLFKAKLLNVRRGGHSSDAMAVSSLAKMLALPNLRDASDLQACLCLVDCQNFLKITEYLNAPASQVRSADWVLINKTDLVDSAQVQEVIEAVQAIAPDVPYMSRPRLLNSRWNVLRRFDGP